MTTLAPPGQAIAMGDPTRELLQAALMYALVPLFVAFYASGWLEAHVF